MRIVATNYDGSPHWSHPARLLHADDAIVITATSAGLAIERVAGPFTSPFNTRAHYWPDRYFNVIRLEEPGRGLTGYYCNIAAPLPFDGENVRYIDLQLDVRVYVSADGALTWALLDEDEFEAATVQYGYDEALVGRCRAAVAQIVAMVEAREFPVRWRVMNERRRASPKLTRRAKDLRNTRDRTRKAALEPSQESWSRWR